MDSLNHQPYYRSSGGASSPGRRTSWNHGQEVSPVPVPPRTASPGRGPMMVPDRHHHQTSYHPSSDGRSPVRHGGLLGSDKREANPQLANLKNQWNVERDIPSGTVRNSPFAPKKPEPRQVPTQLYHQKKQWDTKDIPQGAVASRLMSEPGVSSSNSPLRHRPYPGTSSPKDRSSPEPEWKVRHYQQDEEQRGGGYYRGTGKAPSLNPRMPLEKPSVRATLSSSSTPPRRSYPVSINSNSPMRRSGSPAPTPEGSTSLRGRLMENPPPPSNSGNSTGWQPNKEIPKGKVKGMSSLFGSSEISRSQHRPVSAGTIQELGKIADSDDEDPWIIPDKPSRPKTMAFVGEEDSWAAGGVPKSNLSEDSEEQWNNNDRWFQHPSESQSDAEDDNRAHKTAMRNIKPMLYSSRDDDEESQDPVLLNDHGLEAKKSAPAAGLLHPPINDSFSYHSSSTSGMLQPPPHDTMGYSSFSSKSPRVASTSKDFDPFESMGTRSSSKDNASSFRMANSSSMYSKDTFEEPSFEPPPPSELEDYKQPASLLSSHDMASQQDDFDDVKLLSPRDASPSPPSPRLPIASPRIEYSHADTSESRNMANVGHGRAPSPQNKERPSPFDFTRGEPSSTVYDLPEDSRSHITESYTPTGEKHYDLTAFDATYEDSQQRLVPDPIHVDIDEHGDDNVGKVNGTPSKKGRKGLFKLFGGGSTKNSKSKKKERRSFGLGKKNKTPVSESPLKESSRGMNSVYSPSILNRAKFFHTKGEKLEDSDHENGLGATKYIPANYSGPPVDDESSTIENHKSGDHTTVSEMTMPTVFKHGAKTTTVTLPSVPNGSPQVPPATSVAGSGINAGRSLDPGMIEENLLAAPHSSKSDLTEQAGKEILLKNSSTSIKHAQSEYSDPALDHIGMLTAESEEVSAASVEKAASQEKPVVAASPARAPTPLEVLRERRAAKVKRMEVATQRPKQESDRYKNVPAPPSISSAKSKPNGNSVSLASKSGSEDEVSVHPKSDRLSSSSTKEDRRAWAESKMSKSTTIPFVQKKAAYTNNNAIVEKKLEDAMDAKKQVKSHPETSKADLGASTRHRQPMYEDVSGRTQRTAETSSSEVLRSILHRPRREPVLASNSKSQPVFATYEDKNLDPMQRAGLRLLSAAVVPIQTEARRFLATRRALERMWALIVIQTYARRWMARKEYKKKINGIAKFQAIVRGRDARAELLYQHVCAIEIQRVVRGYLSTLHVYDDFYKITMIQSFVRMNQAIDKAMYRMAFVIQLQAIARSWLTRRRIKREQEAALTIQKNWRCFFKRLTFQFDLLDIIIVQSIWRRRQAAIEAQKRRLVLQNDAATKIQTLWRSYDCTMNYLHFLADVLIAQSAVRRRLASKKVAVMRDEHRFQSSVIIVQMAARRYLARKKALALRNERDTNAAIVLQSAWRGFSSYADYMFVLADIVVAQKMARAWMARRRAEVLRDEKTRLVEKAAAISIQSCWRRYWFFSNYVIALDCVTQIQAVFRGFNERQKLAKIKQDREQAVATLMNAGQEIGDHEVRAASFIQKVWRGSSPRKSLTRYLCARKIQSIWRCKKLHQAFVVYRAAVRVQSQWRRVIANRVTTERKKNVDAAVKIQSAWRGFVCFTDYIFTIADIVAVQKLARGFIARKKHASQIKANFKDAKLQKEASIKIQRICRGFIAKQRYYYTLGCTMQIQTWARSRMVFKKFKRLRDARLTLQCFARCCLARQKYLERKFIFNLIRTAAQEKNPRVMPYRPKSVKLYSHEEKDHAARVIQRFFLMVKAEVDRMVAQRKKKHQRRRKRQQKLEDKAVDSILDDAWSVSVNEENLRNEPMYKCISKIPSRSRTTHRSTTSKRASSRSRSQNMTRDGGMSPELKSTRPTKTKPLLPPAAYAFDQPSGEIRVTCDDSTVLSCLTSATNNMHRRMPPSRMKKLNSAEINEDLELEEAFIDAEIQNAKERRLAGKQRQRSASPAPLGSRHSNQSFGNTKSSQSTGTRHRVGMIV